MFKMTENSLLDTFQVTGNSLDELKEVLDTITKSTRFMKWRSGDIELLSYKDRERITVDKKDPKTGNYVLNPDGTKKSEKVAVVSSYLLTPNKLPSANPDYALSTFAKAYRESSVKTKELLREWTDDVKLAIVFNDNNAPLNEPKKSFYFASANALQTMDRFGMAGDFLLTPCIERDMMIAKSFEKDLGITVIAREVNNTKKIFSILSDKYTHIDQSIFFDIIKEIEDAGEMGEAKCYEWRVNNFFTKLYIEFPKKAKEFSVLYGLKREMIPGILMTTSDTGDSSFKVFGTWRVEGSNSLVVHSEVKKKHIGNIDTAEVLKDISNQIFAEYARLPEALCNLMAHDITDASWDLSSTAGLKANYSEIENVVKTAFKRLGIVKAIGKKMEKKLREAMMNEFDVSIRYTAYDIAMSILSLPERAVFMDKDKDITQLQKVCANAPFISYEVDSSVILTA